MLKLARRKFLQIIGLSPVPMIKKKVDQYNPPHNSLQQPRLNRMPERIYAEVWKKYNKRRPGVNEGLTYLEWILCPSDKRYPLAVSDRDAEVAACIIQWLGTSCGLGFMTECEARIKKEEL